MIRLYDIQVILTSAPSTQIFQSIAQYQSQLAQAHTAIQLHNETINKHDQIQATEQETNTKAIEGGNIHLRQWKKEKFTVKNKVLKQSDTDKKNKSYEISHIIDIKI